jgi:hypothetical protein
MPVTVPLITCLFTSKYSGTTKTVPTTGKEKRKTAFPVLQHFGLNPVILVKQCFINNFRCTFASFL